MHGIERRLAINFPASSTFPPPAAITPSQLFSLTTFETDSKSSSQQSLIKFAIIGSIPSLIRSSFIRFLMLLVI